MNIKCTPRNLTLWTALLLLGIGQSARGTEWIDVKTDFGAVGNGIADDTAAIQNAMTLAEQTGAAVNIPPGTYLVGPISLGNPSTAGSYHPSGQAPGVSMIRGAGSTSRFKAKPGAYAAGQAVLTRRNIIALTMGGFTVDGANVAPGGIDISFDPTKVTAGGSVDPTSWSTIHNILIENCTAYGVDFDRVYDSKISSIFVRRLPDTAVAFSLQGPGGMLHADNVYVYTGRVLLSCQNSSIIQSGFFSGIEFTGGAYNMANFTGCHFFPNQITGITINSTGAGNSTSALSFTACFFGANASVYFSGRYWMGATLTNCHFNGNAGVAFFNNIVPAAFNSGAIEKRPLFTFDKCRFNTISPLTTSASTVARVELKDSLVSGLIVSGKNY